MYNDVTVENADKKKGNGTVAASTPASTAATGSYESKEKAELWERFSGDWIWRAVECLVRLKEFNPSPRWISNRLGISVEQAVDAIDGLLALSLIKRDQEGGYVVSDQIDERFKNLEKEKFKDLIESHFIMSNQINSRIKVSKYNDTYMRNLIFAGSRSEVDKCLRKINEAIKELVDSKSADASDAGIYGGTIAFVALQEGGENEQS